MYECENMCGSLLCVLWRFLIAGRVTNVTGPLRGPALGPGSRTRDSGGHLGVGLTLTLHVTLRLARLTYVPLARTTRAREKNPPLAQDRKMRDSADGRESAEARRVKLPCQRKQFLKRNEKAITQFSV